MAKKIDMSSLAARASREFVERYRQRNASHEARRLVSESAYRDLQKAIERQMLLVSGRKQRPAPK